MKYEKPVITQIHIGKMNKMGQSLTNKCRSDIDGVKIDDIMDEFGSPVFIISEKVLRKKYREMKRAFTTAYPNVEFSWSYKTNYLDAVCATLHQEGETAEVVSDFEYEKARRLGVPGNKIIFNGPYKPYAALKIAVKEGARIHIDSIDEIIDLELIAKELNVTINVGIRLNMDTGIQPKWSRFGFCIDTDQASDTVKRLLETGRLRLTGLHSHIGTFIMAPDAYAVQVKKMLSFSKLLKTRFGINIDYIDIGGGFPSQSRLKGVYLPPSVAIPSINEYAESIAGSLLADLDPGFYPKLIIESGRAIVDEAGFLATSVHAIKRLSDGLRAYVMDAGVNLLFTNFWYRYNIETVSDSQGVLEPCVLYGPLCMNIDVLDELSYLPPLKRGDRLVISPVGAYNMTQWMQFINYRPPIVMVTEQGDVELIREGESLQDICARERLPKHLNLEL
ncbi:MAG: diaminopimelate decarboxylase [Candidatus Riflebacteria bacterium GWC2_50_8]|nr:MAG: diaminopimelate decarboxylase [Candidatus Riflebacteria bacterium GWC2_50_8]